MSSSSEIVEIVGQKRSFDGDSIAAKRPRHEEQTGELLDHSMIQPDLFSSSHSSIDSAPQPISDAFPTEPVVAPSYRTIPMAMLDADLYAPDVNELLDLQNEADIDIEALRRAMAEQEDLEPEEDEDQSNAQSSNHPSDEEVDSDVDLEDEIDENDLPRLKDLQQAGLISYSQAINRAINQMMYSNNNSESYEFESDDDDEDDTGLINHTPQPPHEIHINDGISPFDLPALANSSMSLPVVTPNSEFESEEPPNVESNVASNGVYSEPSIPFFDPSEPADPVILKCSRVGDLYQATSLPPLLSSEEKVVDEAIMQIYDGQKVELQGIVAPDDFKPPSLKEKPDAHQPDVLNNHFEAPAVVSGRRPRASAQRARESIAETIANEQSIITINQSNAVSSENQAVIEPNHQTIVQAIENRLYDKAPSVEPQSVIEPNGQISF